MLAAPTVPGAVARHRRRRLTALLVALAALTGVLGATASPPTGAAPGGGPAAGIAPPSGFGEPGIPVRPASERYVRESYQAILGRDADESGLGFWGGQLDAGGSRASFARLLIASPESLGRHVDDIFETVGHEPATGERAAAVAALRSRATTIEALLIALVSSQEYYEASGGSDSSWIGAMYQDLLGYEADQAGLDFWLGRLAAGATNRQVAKEFVLAPPRLRVAVADAYTRVLGRPSDAPGLEYWVGRIRRGLSIIDVDKNLLASPEAWGAGCSLLDTTRCLLPFPNDEMTLPDATTETGRRVVFKPTWVPAPAGGPAFDPREWNRQDGFSPGSAILVHNGGIDPAQSDLPPLTDIASSLDADSPIVIVDLDTGDRWPFWAELDANATNAADRALVIRPARNFLDGHRYAVGIGDVKDVNGNPIAPSTGFRIVRDELPSTNRYLNERRPMIEEAIDAVTEAGLTRSTLHLSWSFTVASTRNLAERAVHMRDEVLGGTAGTIAPEFTVTNVTPQPGDETTRVEGTFEVPKYLTGTGGPGSRLNLGTDNLPEPNGTYTAPFVCTVPDRASGAEPARPSLYGHGLLGTGGQSNGGYHKAMGREHNVLYCGTDYIGMSDSDLANTVGIVSNLSRFPELVDRNQQGLLNFLVLGRLMTLAEGFESDPAFQDGGVGVIDNDNLYWDGISQGGIMGGAVVALSTDITRGALGVPAINYSTLLERSVDFDPFFAIMAGPYPNPLDRIMLISVIQMLWDRGEGNGYANHITTDPLPGAPEGKELLLHPAFGDHQVAPIAADVYARTIGAATNDPPLDEGRLADVTPLWGIERIEEWPYAGSAIVYWDEGTPAPPLENKPNRAGDDPHGAPRADPDARKQISLFLQPDGVVEDVCFGDWCPADGTTTP